MQDMSNPVLEERNDVLVLDTKFIMELISGTVVKVKTIDQDQYSKFFDELLSKCVSQIHWITPFALTVFGIYIKEIGLKVQPDKKWAKVCGGQLFSLHWF